MAAGRSIAPTRWQLLLDELLGRIAGRFTRVEPRRRTCAFVRGPLADLRRKTCWSLAEHAGDHSPDGVQHLLAGAVWDEDAVRDDVRDDLVEHLGDAHAVLIIDAAGHLKKGEHTVGVQRVLAIRCTQPFAPEPVAGPPATAAVLAGRIPPERWLQPQVAGGREHPDEHEHACAQGAVGQQHPSRVRAVATQPGRQRQRDADQGVGACRRADGQPLADALQVRQVERFPGDGHHRHAVAHTRQQVAGGQAPEPPVGEQAQVGVWHGDDARTSSALEIKPASTGRQEMADGPRLLRIGELATRGEVSVSALRFYDTARESSERNQR